MGYHWEIIERELFSKRFGSMGVQEMKKVLFAVYLSGESVTGCQSDYAIGQQLGLTVAQVKNLRIGANLLLDNAEDTLAHVRRSLGTTMRESRLEYQKARNRISVQVDDPIAFSYLSACLKETGTFSDCDARNGHISVPVNRFGDVLRLVFPELDEVEIESRFSLLVPEYKREDECQGGFYESLSKWLPKVEQVGSAISSLSKCIGLLASVYQ